MRIYVSHSRIFDFKKDLYDVIERAQLNHAFIFPHKDSEESFNSKELFQNHECDMVLADGSYQATGQGIELGWANILGIKIVTIYKKGSHLSHSLKNISEEVIEFTDPDDLINKLKDKFSK